MPGIFLFHDFLFFDHHFLIRSRDNFPGERIWKTQVNLDTSANQTRFNGFFSRVSFYIKNRSQHPDIYIPGMNNERFGRISYHIKKALPTESYFPGVSSKQGIIGKPAACVQPNGGSVREEQIRFGSIACDHYTG